MRRAWAAAGLGLLCLSGCTPPVKEATEQVEAVKLCGLEDDPYYGYFDVEAGMYNTETLAVPKGANAMRLDANFTTFGNDPKWPSTVSLLLTTTTGEYILRYVKWSKDKTLRVQTETDTTETTTAETTTNEHDFDASPALGDYLYADMSWTPDGMITTTIYADEDGFDGTGESHAFKGGVPKSVEVLVSTAEADINSLSFAHVCTADEAQSIEPPMVTPRVTDTLAPVPPTSETVIDASAMSEE